MKKMILSLCFVLANVFAFANTSTESLNLDQKVIDSEFKQLDKVEAYVQQHEGITLDELQNSNATVIENVSIEKSSAADITKINKNMPIVGGFWWGCLLGVIGLALVYFISDNDSQEVKAALWGCLISTILLGGGLIWNPF